VAAYIGTSRGSTFYGHSSASC